MPADVVDQHLAERQHDELAERTGGAGNAKRHAALFRWKGAADHAKNNTEATARQGQTDQHAGTETEVGAARRICHPQQAQRVNHGAGDHHAGGAEAVGNHAGEGLRDTVDQILQRHRKRERLTVPFQIHRHRQQEQAEAVTGAECDGECDAAGQQNNGRRAPVFALDGWGGHGQVYRIGDLRRRDGTD